MREENKPLTVKEAIEILKDLNPDSILITERSLSDNDGVAISPQSTGRTLIF